MTALQPRIALLLTLLLSGAAAPAQPFGESIVPALRAGGYVIVLRHARAPRDPPAAADAHPDNVDRERQLDAVGHADAAAVGAALRELRIPIGEVLSSPTFRARETVRELRVGDAALAVELGDGGKDMQAGAEAARSRWLRERAARRPAAGTNTLIVTHLQNITGAFGEEFADTAEADALIVEPADGGARVLGRIKVADWPALTRDR
jgi:phosphohistidine phosphatase SixA